VRLSLKLRVKKGQYAVVIPAQIAAKAALYQGMKEQGMKEQGMKATRIDKSDLARGLGRDKKEVQCLLNPKQS